MNSVERAALLVHRDTIVQDVDFNYIKEKLLAYSILNHEELEEIDYEKTRSAKIRKLLDVLPRKGPHSFDNFVKTLEADYYWVAEKLLNFSNPDCPDASSSVNRDPDLGDSLNKILQEAIIVGGIPFPPPFLIPRAEKIAQIRQCLREMSLGQFIVLHGMAGTGKSVLAAESVRDVELMISTFDSNIYWLTIGQTDRDTLLTKMQALCERLDHSGVPPLSVDQASERLRRLMSDPRRKNSLLILDDVWRGEVVRAFDFGCKIMLTTRDATVTDVVQGRAQLIKVHDGFTQEESMTYLANCLQLTVEELPDQAYQIYSESKGSPMVLSILAPVLADRGSPQRIDAHRWDHYVGKLRDRKYTQIKRQGSYSYETVNEAIAISVDHLDEDIRNLLNDFVIFLDDVNIPAPVLEVLWNMSRYEVEEKMMILLKKSLVAQHVNGQSYTVLYGIHDLLLDYLKSRMTYEEQQVVHRKLVDAYVSKCGGDFGSLPNDNYIFWFLGYHLYKGNCSHLFPQIYLNLNFIAAKLRATGPSDLLNDFRKYVDYISGKDGNSDHVEDFSQFIRTSGHIVVQCPQLDIVQLALQQPKNSQVYRTALECAKMDKFGFHVEWCNRQESKGQALRSTVLNYGHVTAACFTEDGNRLLSAIGDGQIRMWDVDSGKELHRFTGHNGCVHHLALSSDSMRLVSSSADGTVKVWDLKSVTRKLDESLQRPTKTPSPRMRQDSWHNMFDVSGRVITDDSLVTYAGHTNEVLCSQFSENGALIVSCGMDRTARIWLSTAAMELGELKHPDDVKACCFSPEGGYIATGCIDSTIRIWSASNYSCVALFHEQSSRVLFVSFLSDTSLLSVSDTEILLWNWRYPNDQDDDGPSYSVEPMACTKDTHCYHTAAVDDSRQLLAVSTSDESILLFNISQKCQVHEFIGHTGSITSLHFAPPTHRNDPPRFLLSGSQDETVMVWNVNVDYAEDHSLSATAFHTVWAHEQPELFVTASAGSGNRVELMSGLNAQVLHTTELECEPIEVCAISNGIAMLAWGTKSGSIRLLSLKTKSVKEVGHHSDKKLTLLKFSLSDVLLVSASEDGCVKIWKHDGDCVTVWGSRKGIVDCHFIDKETQLLTCGADGSIRTWRVDRGQPIAVLLSDVGLHVICFDRSADSLTLAQGTSSHGLQLISVSSDLLKLNRSPMRLGHHKFPVRVCRFSKSHSKPFLAVGYDTGLIEVYDYTRHLLHSTLEAHRSWVRDVQFVRDSPFFQLVSVGDRIAWWNVLHPKKKESTHSTSFGGYGMPLTPITPGSHYYSNGSESGGRAPIQTFEFQGRFASKLFVSPDGRTVLTITDSGILYILRQLEG